MDHVKSYYNPQLWQSDSKGPSALSTPQLRTEIIKDTNPVTNFPERLAPAHDSKRPSSETETEMPEMAPVREIAAVKLEAPLAEGNSKGYSVEERLAGTQLALQSCPVSRIPCGVMYSVHCATQPRFTQPQSKHSNPYSAVN